jgi:putative Holliday junction resolvase
VSLSGEEGVAARKARDLGAQVEEATGCEIVFFDERFTTVQAESALLEGGVRRSKRRETVDKVAAAVILQGYLDSRVPHDG